MKKLLTAVVLSLALNGCVISDSMLQSMSAGQTGCSPENNQVSNRKGVTGGLSWNAVCNNKTYLCTSISNGKDTTQTSCAVAQ